MARTRLFTVLRRWTAEWRQAHNNEVTHARSKRAIELASGTERSPSANSLLTRRELVAAGLGSLSFACVPQSPASRPVLEPAVASDTPRVAVVGAGIAGLHAAYRLEQAAVPVEVFEASERIGGRLHTGRGLFPDQQVCELGGELIDSNHRWVRQLCGELGLTLDDRFAALPDTYARETWFVAGRVVPEATVAKQFAAVVAVLAKHVEAAENDPAVYHQLNHTTLQTYLSNTVPPAQFPELHAVLAAAYVGEFGLEISEQSALNLLYLIGTKSEGGLQLFGESDERYHVHGGNDQLPLLLAQRLKTRVHLGHRLVRAAGDSGSIELTFQAASGARTARFSRVVFAIPFTTLRQVDLTELPLSQLKRRIINELGYGTNAKLMLGFRTALWRTQYQASGAVTSDTALQQTWDSSIGQFGASAVLTNFLGGKLGLESGTGEAEAWGSQQLALLEQVFPGISAEYSAGSGVRMHWPSARHALGSYACYRPGQWEFWGKEGLPEGAAHFCGEHTSAEFQGWIEGAAESGARVALEVQSAPGVPVPVGS
jgi:monoamine oxidase